MSLLQVSATLHPSPRPSPRLRLLSLLMGLVLATLPLLSGNCLRNVRTCRMSSNSPEIQSSYPSLRPSLICLRPFQRKVLFRSLVLSRRLFLCRLLCLGAPSPSVLLLHTCCIDRSLLALPNRPTARRHHRHGHKNYQNNTCFPVKFLGRLNPCPWALGHSTL